MPDETPALVPFPLRQRMGWCQFCGGAVREAKFAPLNAQRFRYMNDCGCLHYAVLVVEPGGCYYWKTISYRPRDENARAQAIWDKWQQRDLNNLSPGIALSPTPEAAIDTQVPFDAHLYEEAQIILSMYG